MRRGGFYGGRRRVRRQGELARGPLRGLLRQAAADVLFFVPVTSWWAARQREHAELRADSAAIHQVGVSLFMCTGQAAVATIGL